MTATLVWLGYCPRCGRDVPADFCDHCGKPVTDQPRPVVRLGGWCPCCVLGRLNEERAKGWGAGLRCDRCGLFWPVPAR